MYNKKPPSLPSGNLARKRREQETFFDDHITAARVVEVHNQKSISEPSLPSGNLARKRREQETFFDDHITAPRVVEAYDQKSNNELRQRGALQETVNVGERLKGCLPTDLKSFLFALVALVGLVVGVMHFFGWTGDASTITNLLVIIGGYEGLTEVAPIVTPLISRGMKREHNQQPPTSE